MAHEITTLDELAALDGDECIAGYRAGLENSADFNRRDKGYWHGYLNGLVDGGHAKPSAAQQELVRACLADPLRSPWGRLANKKAEG